MTTGHGFIAAAAAPYWGSGCAECAPHAAWLPQVGSATDITSFHGARAGQVGMGLGALGYKAVRGEGLAAF